MAIFGPCAQVFPESLIRIRDFQVREQFSRVASPNRADRVGSTRRDLDRPWKRNACALSRMASRKKFPTASAANLQANHLIVQADGSRPGILRRRARRTAAG